MSNLPNGIRRVYNTLYKRKFTGAIAYSPTPSEVKDYFDSVNFNHNEITEEQFNQAVKHFSKGTLSTEVKTESAIVHPTQQEVKEIVSSKAVEMSLQLSSGDVDFVANQIDATNSTLDEILDEVESLLIAYADHKQQESISKIDSMFDNVYNHVQLNNSLTSRHLSSRMTRLGSDVEQAQQDFKSSINKALSRLKV